MKDRTSLIYKMMQGCFWMLYCCFYGYVTYFLLQKDFETEVIGYISAGFGLISAIMQPMLGRLADRTKAGWKIPHIIILSLVALVSVLLMVTKNNIAEGIIFGFGVMLMGCMMPLLNAASFNCKRAGHNVDFGKARGIGSLTYAILSVILGRLTVAYGEWVIPVAALIVCVIYMTVLLQLPQYSNFESGTGPVQAKSAEGGAVHSAQAGSIETASGKAMQSLPAEGSLKDEPGFIRKYPAFMLMFLAGICFMTFHNMTNQYMIQMFTEVGGNSNSLGIAHAIAALCELPIMFGFVAINKKIKVNRILLIGGIGFIIKATLYVISGSVATIYVTQFLQIVSFAPYGSGSVYYAEEVCSARDKATGQAFMSSSITSGYVIGCLIGGWLVTKLGITGMEIVGVVIVAVGTALALISNIMDGSAGKVKNA